MSKRGRLGLDWTYFSEKEALRERTHIRSRQAQALGFALATYANVKIMEMKLNNSHVISD